MTAPTDIAARIAAIRERIEHSCERAGRSPEEVTLLAVSKRKSTANIETAIEAGQLDFAENYIQEARDKRPEIHVAAEGIRWHFIGHLQSNKAKEAVRLFDVIHTVDRPKLARELEKHAAALEKTLRMVTTLSTTSESISRRSLETRATPVSTRCERPTIRLKSSTACSGSRGFPRTSESTTTMVSAPRIQRRGSAPAMPFDLATSTAFSIASRSTRASGDSPGLSFSSMPEGRISNAMPALASNAWRRGEALAKINMGSCKGMLREVPSEWNPVKRRPHFRCGIG